MWKFYKESEGFFTRQPQWSSYVIDTGAILFYT